MKNLKKLLTTPFQSSVSKGLIAFLFVIATIGFVDATFLTIEHFMNEIPPCTTNGCEIVLTSAYSTVAGIPVALLGTLYYLVFLILLMAYLDTKKESILRGALLLTSFGFLASLYFSAIQVFVIDAFCQYCLVSAATSTILFITAISIFRKYGVKDLGQNNVCQL